MSFFFKKNKNMMHWKMLVVLHWNFFYHLLQLLPSPYLWLCCEMLMLCWNISYSENSHHVIYELKYLCMHVCCYPYNGHLLTPSIFIEYVNLSKERKEQKTFFEPPHNKIFPFFSLPSSPSSFFWTVHEKVFHHHF